MMVDPVINLPHKSTLEPVQYPCNFCGKSFTELRKWREHEEGLHLPKQAYVCFYCSADATCVKVGKDSCYAIEAADTFQGVGIHSIMAQAIGSALGKSLAKTLTRRKNLEKHLAEVHKVHKPGPHPSLWVLRRSLPGNRPTHETHRKALPISTLAKQPANLGQFANAGKSEKGGS